MSKPRGRPRDPTFDQRALEATRALLEERGFDGTTVAAVAERSGVHASALYRRWPSRIALIEEATFPGFDPVSVRATGDLRADLRRFLRAYVRVLNGPALRAAAPGLLAHHQASRLRDLPRAYERVSARPQLAAILRAAPPGSIDPAIDPDDVFDMILGSVLVRTLVFSGSARKRSTERGVELILRMLRA